MTDRGLLKVGDFGTSRFLEIAAHGTTVIGSPPYMAPEQFEGRAVFASDLYSLGVTMYQMLTGSLPYDTPAPSDLDRLRRGELVSPPRTRNPAIPKVIDEIVMRALRGRRVGPVSTGRGPSDRYSGCAAVNSSVARQPPWRHRPGPRAFVRAVARRPATSRHRTREIGGGRFCLQCRKPLPTRGGRCPFCGEAQ